MIEFLLRYGLVMTMLIAVVGYFIYVFWPTIKYSFRKKEKVKNVVRVIGDGNVINQQ